jgi:Putative F0F1-ATPase subunit Ca2+/Mg2+ transporter
MGDKGLGKAAILATQLGFSVACPLAAFIAGGVWADGKLGTKPWLFFLGLVIGVVAAGAALYQVAVAQPSKRSEPAPKEAPDKIERGGADGGTNQSGGKLGD